MPDHLLVELAKLQKPAFITQESKLQMLRRLQGAGYLDVRFYPPRRTADQFAELRGVTPLGRKVLAIMSRSDVHPSDRGV